MGRCAKALHPVRRTVAGFSVPSVILLSSHTQPLQSGWLAMRRWRCYQTSYERS